MKTLTDWLSTHQGWLIAIAYKITRNHHVAEDCASWAQVKMMESWDKYDKSRPLATWAYVIVTRCAYDTMRRAHMRDARLDAPLSSGDADSAVLADLLEDHAPIPEQRLIVKEMARQVNKILYWKLRPKHAKVLRQVYMYGLSYDEAAAKLNLKQGTVRSRISRAMIQFRKHAAQAGLS